jgi:hypothetical protein
MRRQRPRPLRWVGRGAPTAVDRRLGLDAAGTYAARSIRRHGDRTHAAALALVDELIAMGRSAPPARGRLAAIEARALVSSRS